MIGIYLISAAWLKYDCDVVFIHFSKTKNKNYKKNTFEEKEGVTQIYLLSAAWLKYDCDVFFHFSKNI